ncbi:antitoxin Xre/MbcA/ParS toxin-binding domain-containing protein [Pedobacter steynii]|uniref:type II RES/Xre toxin-antitoxin system antitoxin n=1 Tax=Pedobacter steynii TaxID=430522 RepID=UPI0009F67545|nr:antitoxin Xre/MbcA/ParS toxin-binding domain-containing protein [Pedobacter steynii]
MASTPKPYKTKAKVSVVAEAALIAPYQSLYTNSISVLTSAKNGLSAKAALDFLSLSGFTREEFQDTFKTNVKTIENYVSNAAKLDASLSEKLLKSFSLFEKGIEIFGTAKAFHLWLNTPSYGLGNQVPFDLMDTITGISLIEEELIRIEYGDLA